MTTIEKMAYAIERAHMGGDFDWSRFHPEAKEMRLEQARAALQAIRVVDEDTFRAGEKAMPGYNDCGPGEPWLAMIDHILSQGHGK